MANITIKIPFLSWTGKPDLSVEIDASIETRFHLRAALTKAVSDGANLDGANLDGANLDGANLDGANLYGANLDGANLTRANLDGANLDGANLTRANLTRANLDGANLTRANLYGANLDGANLTRANLTRANLTRANLTRANLYGANNLSPLAAAHTSITPEGVLVGWKKCQAGVLVQVMIPLEARRSNATGRKCRAEYVEVLSVVGGDVGVSQHDGKTEYRKGDTVRCDKWCENRWQECAGGIHFFLSREEAEAY